jgi:hypothetical protein
MAVAPVSGPGHGFTVDPRRPKSGNIQSGMYRHSYITGIDIAHSPSVSIFDAAGRRSTSSTHSAEALAILFWLVAQHHQKDMVMFHVIVLV